MIGALCWRRSLEGGRQLRPAVERVGALAGLDLLEGLDQAVTLGLGEPSERRLLRFKTKAPPCCLQNCPS